MFDLSGLKLKVLIPQEHAVLTMATCVPGQTSVPRMTLTGRSGGLVPQLEEQAPPLIIPREMGTVNNHTLSHFVRKPVCIVSGLKAFFQNDELNQ